MKYPEHKNLRFTIKSEEELRGMSLQRLKKYYRAEQARLRKEIPWCCELHCFEDWPDEDYEKCWKAWEMYVEFVCAIYHDRIEEVA